MEPRREEEKALQPGAGQKPRRFRIVKLEERIAPAKGGNRTNNCVLTLQCPSFKHCSDDLTCWWCR